jgi:hypothetical protein
MTNKLNSVIVGGGQAIGEDAACSTQEIATSSDRHDIAPDKNTPRVPRLYLASVNAYPAAPPAATPFDRPLPTLWSSLFQFLMEGFAAYACLYPGAFLLDSLTDPTNSPPEKSSSPGDGSSPDHCACAAATLISRGRMSAAAIASRHSAPNACSIVTKPPRSYSHATSPTDAPAAVKPTK